jgi:hypothetical protein
MSMPDVRSVDEELVEFKDDTRGFLSRSRCSSILLIVSGLACNLIHYV